MNVRALIVAVTSLASLVALFVLASGPLRGLFGDVVVIVAGVATLASIGLGSPRVRVVGMLGLGFAIEAVQTLEWVGPDSHWLAHMVLGSTFDPVDLGMYVLGAACGAGLEWWWQPASSGQATRYRTPFPRAP